MGERRALVIGAPNDRFGPLTFLPAVVRRLHELVRDPYRGSCAPALPDGRDLLVGAAATGEAIGAAITGAVVTANRDRATLFVYFCGHGFRGAADFYLIGVNTPPDAVNSATAFPLGHRITELLESNATLDGLMLILDACHAGDVVANPVRGLFHEAMQGRIEFLTATRPEEVASKGCFSRSLVELLTLGSAHTADPELLAYREHDRLHEVAPEECRDMASVVHLSLNGSQDAGLWLGRNLAADLRPPLIGTRSADVVARLTRDWQRPPVALGALMRLLGTGSSLIGITGGPGTGKSALLASLGRRSAGDLLGLDALVVVAPGDTLALLAPRLQAQLAHGDAYQSAAQRWQQATPVIDQNAAPAFERLVTGPLAHLGAGNGVRIGVDAADQLDTVQRRRLIDAAARLPEVTLLLTGRRLDEVPPAATVELPGTDPDGVTRLLAVLIDDEAVRHRVAVLADGEWLLARILAALSRAGHLSPATPLTDLTDLHAAFDAAIMAARTAAPHAPIDDVLRLLAAAPVGTWMPLQTLTAALDAATEGDAAAQQREPDVTTVRVRDVLVALGELVARAEPGEITERVGPAHDLIADHLVGRYGHDAVRASHSTIAKVLAELISGEPPAQVRAYVSSHLSEHLAAAGRTTEALEYLPTLSTPADNLALWQAWLSRLEGPDHPETLTTRRNIAFWTGQAGEPGEARRLFRELLPDMERVLGPDHPETLTTRYNIAVWTGDAGEPAEALRLCRELLPDMERVLGRDHSNTLATRAAIAFWTGRAGEPAEALRLYRELLPDRARVLGRDHPDTLAARANIAVWTGRAGEVAEALRLYQELLSDYARVLGRDHPDTLRTRRWVAYLQQRIVDES